MNFTLKTGESFTNEATGQEYNSIIGGLKDLNFNIRSGSMSNVSTLKVDVVFKIRFFASIDLMQAGKEEIFSNQIYLDTDKVLTSGILQDDPELGFKINEKSIYDYLLSTVAEYSVFEIV